MNGMFVNIVIVLAWTQSTIFLFDEEEGRCLRGVGGSNFP